MKLKSTISAGILLLGCHFLIGQEIITDRPDQTESSSTVPRRSLQIESGVLLGFEEGDKTSSRQLLAPTSLFRLGLTDGIELRILSQFESLSQDLKSTNGISDLEIGTKVQLLQKEGLNIELAFLSHLIIPTGSKGLANEKFGVLNKLSISHELNDHIDLGYNVGYNYFGEGQGCLTYSLALGVGLTDKLGVYLEPYGEFVEFEELLANFDAGLTYLLRDNFQLDYSFGTGINHRMNYLSMGFSWLIGG